MSEGGSEGSVDKRLERRNFVKIGAVATVSPLLVNETAKMYDMLFTAGYRAAEYESRRKRF